MNTKCMTGIDKDLHQSWSGIKDTLFSIFNNYNTKVKIMDLKDPSKTDKTIDASIENKNNDKDVESDNVDLEEKDQKVKNEKKNETSDSESEK